MVRKFPRHNNAQRRLYLEIIYDHRNKGRLESNTKDNASLVPILVTRFVGFETQPTKSFESSEK